jgi:hypothetical protein
MFGLNAFFRDGDAIYRTYFTSWRGLEVIGPVWSYLDRSLLAAKRHGRTLPRAGRRRSPTSGGGVTTSTSGSHDRAQRLSISMSRTKQTVTALLGIGNRGSNGRIRCRPC